jgi:hypothetical protein
MFSDEEQSDVDHRIDMRISSKITIRLYVVMKATQAESCSKPPGTIEWELRGTKGDVPDRLPGALADGGTRKFS